MNASFLPDHECRLIERFTAATSNPTGIRRKLVSLCSSFRLTVPEQTPLNYTGRTGWVTPWLQRAGHQYRPATLYAWLKTFARLTRWLFREGIIDDDAFAHIQIWRALHGREEPLWLRYNLHRVVERYLSDACGGFTAHYRATLRSVLLDFNAFLNRSLSAPLPDWGSISIEVPLIAAWLRHQNSRAQAPTVIERGGHLRRFLDFAQQERAIARHAFCELLRDYGRRGCRGVIRALLSEDPCRSLTALRLPPRFASTLGDDLKAFAAYKRALGQDFRVEETILAHLDRYLRQRPPVEQHLSAPLLEGWLATTPAIGANARRRRWLLGRQFCQWMTRTDPSFFVPDPLDIPRRAPSRRPFIYTVEQIQTLLHMASELTPVGSLRPRTYRCMIGLLYGTGLRISEALALNVSDFDVGQQVLLIRETKFHKSRYVPVAPTVSASIEEYLERRRSLGHGLPPDEPLFVNEQRRRCTYGAVNGTFLTLLRRAGFRGPPGRPGPRLHDLRHTTAVHRLTRWYEESVDVQAKLPLLSTYLGHGSIAATQIYLTITAELLQHAAARFHRGRRLSATLQEVCHES